MNYTYVTLQAAFLPIGLSQNGKELADFSGDLVTAYTRGNLKVGLGCSGMWKISKMKVYHLAF